ncbi:MAG: fimbria/pilus outer membrane usher protein [Rectinemataceae bacterium]
MEARIEGEDPFLPVKFLRSVLEPSMSSNYSLMVFDVVLAKLEWAGKADLAAAGIVGVWDPAVLSYSISVPAAYSARKNIDFNARNVSNVEQYFNRALVSAVLNLDGSANIRFSGEGVQYPLRLEADGLLNIAGWAFEADLGLSYTDTALVTYNNKARLVHDFPSIKSRLFGGRIQSPGISFQARPEIYGVSLESLPIFSKYDRQDAPSIAFTVEKPSLVRIYANGTLIRTSKMAAGNYRLFDLPLGYGLNALELQFEDGSGMIQVLRTRKPFLSVETGLLIADESEFGFSAGVGRMETDQPYASGFFRHGISYEFTGALFAQADLRSVLTGGSFTYGSQIGSLSGATALVSAWDGRDHPLSVAANLGYRFLIPAKKGLPALTMFAEYTSTGFLSPQPTTTVGVPQSAIQITSQIGGTLGPSLSAGFNVVWRRTLDGMFKESVSLGGNLSSRLLDTLTANLSLHCDFESGISPDLGASLSMNMSDFRNSNSRTGFSQSLDGTNSVSYSDKIPLLGGMGIGLTGTNLIGGLADPSSISLSTSASSPFGDVSLDGGVNYGGSDNLFSSSLSVDASTALAFADGVFAFTRRIPDSFVLFAPMASARGMPLSFSIDGSAALHTNGMAVATPLASYRRAEAAMDFPEADADIVATVPRSIVQTSYRSGVLYRAGLSRQYMVTGRVFDSKGEPFAYIAGNISDAQNQTVGYTFTDEEGVFQVFGLIPGAYSIEWGKDGMTSSFRLDEDMDGIIDLGMVAIETVGR